MLYENYIKNNKILFKEKVRKISKDLGIKPDWLMATMKFESGISPSIMNKTSMATGLIQFMPNTAKSLGTDIYELQKMSNVKQLDYVKKYLLPYKNKMSSPIDVYLSVFYPIAVGKPNNYVIGGSKRSSVIASQNSGFDDNKDNKITKKEIEKIYNERLPELKKLQQSKNIKTIIAIILAILSVASIVFIAVKTDIIKF